MKIGLVADSHDNINSIDRMLTIFKRMEIDVVFHAGDFISPFAVKKFVNDDWEFHAVFGNNDGERRGIRELLPDIKDEPAVFDVNGLDIGVVHDREKWDGRVCDVLLFGHSHKCFYKEDNGRLEINPGELGGWLYGKSTVGVLDSETFDAEIIEV